MPTICQIPRSRNFTFIILFNFNNLIMYAVWWWWWYLPPGIDVLVYSFLMSNFVLTKSMWRCWRDAISVFKLSKVVTSFSELTLLPSQSALIDERVILEWVTCQRTESSFHQQPAGNWGRGEQHSIYCILPTTTLVSLEADLWPAELSDEKSQVWLTLWLQPCKTSWNKRCR